MSDLDAIFQFNARFADPTELIYEPTIAQVSGVGGSGNDYQARATHKYPTTLTRGVFIGRFKSSYNGTDGKNEIANPGGAGYDVNYWPVRTSVTAGSGAGLVSFLSAANLAAGWNGYALGWWIDTNASGINWYDRVFEAKTHTIQQAMDAGAVWPAGNAVVLYEVEDVGGALTISGTTTPATSISGSFSVQTGASAGTVIGLATADRVNGTFSEGTPALSWVTVAANGQLTVTTGQTAPAAGSYSIQLTYNNSGVAGGGSYSQTVSVTVTAASVGGQTPSFIAAPVQNATRVTSIAALTSVLDSLKNDWNGQMTTWGLSTTGVRAIITLGAGVYGDIDWSNYDFSSRAGVDIRGEGPYSRNAYKPTAGTKVGRVRLTNCKNISLWMMQAVPAMTGSGINSRNHRFTNCVDCGFKRCAVEGQVAESESAAAQRAPNLVMHLCQFNGAADCFVINSTMMGAEDGFFGNQRYEAHNSNDILVKGVVLDQGGNDMFQMQGGFANRNWVMEFLLAFGKMRNPQNLHTDLFQSTLDNPRNTGWLLKSVAVIPRGRWGADGSIADKGIHAQYPQGEPLALTVTDCLFGCTGNGISGAGYGNSDVTYCTFMPPIDVSGAEDREYQNGELDVTWSASITGFLGSPVYGTTDYNLVFSNQNYSATAAMVGPNGVYVVRSGLIGTNYGVPGTEQPSGKPNPAGTYDWSVYGDWLENFQHPAVMTATQSRITSALTTAVPRRNDGDGLAMWRAKAGSRAHWDHANPLGAWQLQRRMFHPTEHDHWKDLGWPCAALTHIRYDPNNKLAGASGDYTSFDANGVYLG